MSRKSKNKSKKMELNPSVMESLDDNFSKNVKKLNHSEQDKLYQYLRNMQQQNKNELRQQCMTIKENVNSMDKNAYYGKIYKKYKDLIEDNENENAVKLKYLKGLLSYLETQIKVMGEVDNDDDNMMKLIQSKYEYKRLNDLITEIENNLENN
tara:strand:+ start:104 stop:562 length:459 start_codon:yes stop_codon:yes gene_type:complete